MRLALFAVLVIGCGSKTDSPPAPTAAPTPAPGSGSATTPAMTPVPVDAAARSPKIDAARCGEPCLFLLDTPIAQLPDTYKAKCGGMETKDLGFTDCKQLDFARNCIYAAHGLVYKKQPWKKMFAAKPWYEPHPEVDAKKIAMSDVEHANVHELYERGKACKKNLQISGADFDRIKAWFAALPKSTPPDHGFYWDNHGDDEPDYTPHGGKDFVDWLVGGAPDVKAHFASGKDIYAVYDTAAALAEQKKLVEALHAADLTKLRSITLGIGLAHGTEEEPYTDEINFQFIYDDKDHLVAIRAEHLTMD